LVPAQERDVDEEDEYEEDGGGAKVYFGNLPWDIEWKDLRDVANQVHIPYHQPHVFHNPRVEQS
jgi:hypothetical protein